MIVATAGSDAASATQIEGSPFVAYTDVDRIEGQYAHFTTMDNATLTFKGSYSIPVGTVGTTYTMETPLQAMGGDGEYTFSVSEQPKAGTLTINGGCLVYTYPSNPAEATTATIKVTDGSGNVATATVLIGAALAKTYTLKVENGTGGGTYKAGDEVTIRANDESKSGNMLFDYWTTDPENDITCIDNVNAQETTLTMPAHDLTVTPEYIESANIWLSPGYSEDPELSITILTAVGRDFTLPGKPEEYTHPQGKTFLGWLDVDRKFYAVGSTVHIPEDAASYVYRFKAFWGENAAVTVGGEVLQGLAYATTDDNGNVTVQPTYTESSDWNIKWDGSSTLTLKNAVIKSENGAVSGDSLSVIRLTGSNKVTATGGSGIYSSSTALMINGGGSYNPAVISAPLVTGVHLSDKNHKLFAREDLEGRMEYETELNEMIELLYNCPCIAMWVPFNEGWGQFDAARIAEKIANADPTRTIDHASGWHDQKIGQTKSLHVYFKKYVFKPDKLGRAVMLTEFGGYNYRCAGHSFGSADFGYKKLKSPADLQKALEKLYSEQIKPAYKQGLSAAVYTQLSDVEEEVNGLVTYDRKVVKLPSETMRKIVNVE